MSQYCKFRFIPAQRNMKCLSFFFFLLFFFFERACTFQSDGGMVGQLKFKSRPDVSMLSRCWSPGQERSFRERLPNEKSFAVIITRSFRDAWEKNTGHFYVFPGATVTELPCTPRRGIRYPVFELARVFTNGRAFLHPPRFVTFRVRGTRLGENGSAILKRPSSSLSSSRAISS